MASTGYLLMAVPSTVQIILLGIAIILVLKWLRSKKSESQPNLPPGPMVFPVIGNLPQLLSVKEFNRALIELSEKYGDVYKMRIGPFQMVVVCGLEALKEGLIEKGDIFSGRPNWIFIVDKIFKNGVVFSNGQIWKDLRRFTVSALHNFSMGKNTMEEKIHVEIAEMSKVIKSYQGKPFDLKKPMANGVINVIYNIIFGQRMDYNDPEFEQLVEILEYLFKNASMHLPENFFPWLYNMPWDTPLKKMMRNDEILRAHAIKKLQEHRENFDANNPRDLVDMFILQTQKEESDSFSESTIFRTIVDILSSGSDTSATSLVWTFLYVATYPDVQRQCREEIKAVTNLNRLVKMSDRQDLPFVNATILELQRIATVVPGSIPHVAEEDSTLGGYDILKGTIVQFMFEGVHNDPTYWYEPSVFNPNRWLTENKEIIEHEAFLPFSWGPRSCLGESLAKMELFLFFANLLQQFEFTSSEEDPVSLKGKVTGVTFQPNRSIICAKPI